MRRFRSILPTSALALAVSLGATSCKGLPVRKPYDDGAAPPPELLMQARAAPLSALRVGRAKIRERSLSATLMYVVQGPERFAGTIQIAGNELVSLAVNERNYHLRLKSDRAGRPGYHEGPPSSCAVEKLVGVALEPTDLVSLLLGGAPLAVTPDDARVTEQRWNRRWPGREELELRWAGGRQRLRFAWVDGAWRFAGTRVWRMDGDREVWLWSIEHESFHTVDGEVLPEVTIIQTPAPGADPGRRPSRRRRDVTALTIRYMDQQPDPADLLAQGGDGGDGDGGGWVDTWDDDWSDDEWEDGSSEADAESGAQAAPPTAPPAGPSAPKIPPMFVLDDAGLPARGDLCR